MNTYKIEIRKNYNYRTDIEYLFNNYEDAAQFLCDYVSKLEEEEHDEKQVNFNSKIKAKYTLCFYKKMKVNFKLIKSINIIIK